MTLEFWFNTETEQNFLNLELISIAGSPRKIETQTGDSFDIAIIDATYLK